MNMTKRQVGISCALAVAGAVGLVLQARTNAALQTKMEQVGRAQAAATAASTPVYELSKLDRVPALQTRRQQVTRGKP